MQTVIEPPGFENRGRFSPIQFKAFFSSFLGTYKLNHCWIFILQPQTFRSHHHFFLFFFSRTLTSLIFLSWFSPTVASAFLSLHFFWLLFLHFFSLSLSLSLSVFYFYLCTLESSSLLSLLCVMDMLYCHPLNYCCQVVNHSFWKCYWVLFSI